MSTILVFLITIGQLVAVALAYWVPLPMLWDALVIYGSPPYFIINLLGSNSVVFEQYLLFPLLALFHVIKYLCLCRSQFGTERHSLHYIAVIAEVTYLVICGIHIL